MEPSDTLDDNLNENNELKRSVTVIDGISVITGLIIGTGIFASPGIVVSEVNQVGIALLAWILGGLLAILGGLCFSELGTALPQTGGDYIYLSELHPVFGFSFMWAAFFCIRSGSIAIISLIFARYFGSIIISDLDISNDIDSDYRIKLLGISAIIGIVGLNIIGVKWVVKVQRLFLISKLFAIGFVCIMALYSVCFGYTLNIAKDNLSNIFYITPIQSWTLSSIFFYNINIISAIIGALWAYAGFNTLNMVAEEIINPQRNIPIAIITSLFIVIICYLAVNIAYFLVLPKDIIASAPAVAISVSYTVWGNWAAIITALLVSFSALGSLNANIMTSSRIFYAGAKDKRVPFSNIISLVSSDFGTPYMSIIMLGSIAICVLIPGNLNVLVNYFGFATWIYFGLNGISLIYIRERKKHIQASFKVKPYPLIPIIFIIAALTIVLSAIIEYTIACFFASCFLILSIPVYYLFFWKGNLLLQFIRKYTQSNRNNELEHSNNTIN